MTETTKTEKTLSPERRAEILSAIGAGAAYKDYKDGYKLKSGFYVRGWEASQLLREYAIIRSEFRRFTPYSPEAYERDKAEAERRQQEYEERRSAAKARRLAAWREQILATMNPRPAEVDTAAFDAILERVYYHSSHGSLEDD